ncbi:VPSAGDMMVRF-amide [Caenorhabditis elegans]|uniref:FMRFamide-like neuropeptides 24 n=1 Tax=Caenorhabditis elegans TaxID=6239 RepID=FLP24_CAEEL|nr:VPSAGDMMVRF-amide [Caenorhabditis elegans]O17058.3 RecName: Full=FMRFamide-like neuropeptides 24; Contains: RecName: Full=VPSAGDMMVRF-amide; Flags: Precursor [Caenorhabditis elegans]AAW78866.1 FMRFamide-related peptide precursor [Caenorhabditis elegans]CCD65361.1 VPSAGDMMVRF-amide [Caenorhabditis elegans]|eukprot:NP_497243.3 VPSAGDMMVRF-amide [Caenorhabditis elegans]
MLSSRTSSIILILAILVAIMAVAQCRNIQYDVEEMTPEAAFRYAQWGEIPHKRVPSAGDMMVRFGKRSI